jgi:hypothetical protein
MLWTRSPLARGPRQSPRCGHIVAVGRLGRAVGGRVVHRNGDHRRIDQLHGEQRDGLSADDRQAADGVGGEAPSRPPGDGSGRIGLAASRTGAVRLRRWLGLAVGALLAFRHGARLQEEELPQREHRQVLPRPTDLLWLLQEGNRLDDVQEEVSEVVWISEQILPGSTGDRTKRRLGLYFLFLSSGFTHSTGSPSCLPKGWPLASSWRIRWG